MGGSSADIEALLVDVNDVDNLTPGTLPAIFRDIVGRLDAAGLAYAVVGRIALTLHEQARFVDTIEIVADLGGSKLDQATACIAATRKQFAPVMDEARCAKPISLSLRSCKNIVETGLLAEAILCPWFGVQARIASAEHLLWLWCGSDVPDHQADAVALIRGGTVDLQRVQALLRETDDVSENAQTRLRLAIGSAVLETTFSFGRFMEERRAKLDPSHVPVCKRTAE